MLKIILVKWNNEIFFFGYPKHLELFVSFDIVLFLIYLWILLFNMFVHFVWFRSERVTRIRSDICSYLFAEHLSWNTFSGFFCQMMVVMA